MSTPTDPSGTPEQLGGGNWPKRRFPRLDDPDVVGSLAFRAEAKLVDISKDGMGLECIDALPSNREYRVTVRDRGGELRLRGESIWNRQTLSHQTEAGDMLRIYRAGLRFHEEGPTQSAKVKEFIRSSGARPSGSSPVQRYRPTRNSTVQLSAEAGFAVKTISRSGALLETESCLHGGPTLELSMLLPSGELEVEGRLVETYPAFDDTGVPCTRLAVEFQGLSESGHHQIERLIAACG